MVQTLDVKKVFLYHIPKNIDIGDNVNIGRDVVIFTEISDSKLTIGSECSINARVQLDYSGDLSIGENVFVFEDSVILSHDHGYDPRSKPKKLGKKLMTMSGLVKTL